MSIESVTHSAHYAYVYWRQGREKEPPEYICVSPTFDSRDGEYRRRFVRYQTFDATYQEIASYFALYEEAVFDLIARHVITIKTHVYPESNIDVITDQRIVMSALAVALALDLWELSRNILMVHTSKAYQEIMKLIVKARPDLVVYSENNIAKLSPQLRVFKTGSDRFGAVQCGQKLVPMFAREVVQPFDFNFSTWRELGITKLVGDLSLNFISPSFATYNQWTYIEGANETLFENESMHQRFRRDRATAPSIDSIRSARRGLESDDPTYPTEMLSKQLYESLEYAESFLIMSQVAVLHTMEDVGPSLASLPSFVKNTRWQWPSVVFSFSTYNNGARLLFEYAYAAHCLHEKLAVAHTDLHGNNLTHYLWGQADVRPLGEDIHADTGQVYDDPLVAYVVGTDTFLFPAGGDSGCIIDFSRAIIGPGFRPRLEEGRSPQYANNFYRDQVSRVMRVFNKYAPEFTAKHEIAIKNAVIQNFEAVFSVLCTVDFIAVGETVSQFLYNENPRRMGADEFELRPFEVEDKVITLGRRLEKAARELLITQLHALVTEKTILVPEFPGRAILPRIFGEWLFGAWEARDVKRLRAAQLVDMYNFNNPLKYSGTDYAKYPPWARLDEIERHLGELKIEHVVGRETEPFLEALRPGARVEVIAEEARADQRKKDGPPVPMTSAWLKD